MLYRKLRGQTLVEFALIFPLLLLVLLSVIDGAVLIQGYLTVRHAAQEAARWAIAYQPPQGECLDENRDGNITDEPWPYCPLPGYAQDPNESDEAYYQRRVQLIKIRAVEPCRGLNVNEDVICNGDPDHNPGDIGSSSCISTSLGIEGMLGVQVWGQRTFEDDGLGPLVVEDHPGLQGLPVQVRVVYNVPLVVFAPLLPQPYVRVSSTAEMINEGVQVGYGNRPPPTLPPPPTLNPPGPPPATATQPPTPTAGPSPTPTPRPLNTLTLNFESATNPLPDERAHEVVALVTDPLGQGVAGAQVTFRTTAGSFDYSGQGYQTAYRNTGTDGRARVTLYSNWPTTANLTAWLDYNGNAAVDANEPMDTAIKVWQASGPYLVLSNFNPAPLDWVAVDVMDHPPADNPYSLWWCPITGTLITRQLAFPVNVNASTWDATSIAAQIPSGVAGTYRIESHRGDGGANACGSGTLVAYTAPIRISPPPPDLVISSVTIVDEEYIRPGYPITVVIAVRNTMPVAITTGPFDVDVYLDLADSPMVRQVGEHKQWLTTLGPLESTTITATVTVYELGEHTLWAQVDTSNYIQEGNLGGENNNVYGPVTFEAQECVPLRGISNDFSGGWTGSVVPEGYYLLEGGKLKVSPVRGEFYNIDAAGRRGGYSYLYQPTSLSGNFQITVRVEGVATTYANARAGLVVQAAHDFSAIRFAMLKFSDASTNGVETQWRTTYGGNLSNKRTASQSSPIYLRITREGSTFKSFYSTNGTTWTQQQSQSLPNMPANVIVGLVTSGLWFDSSGNDGITGFATYDNFEACTPPGSSCTPIASRSDNFDSGLGSQWTFENTYMPPPAVATSGGTLSVTPGWGSISSKSDGFHFFTPGHVNGDFRMTVRVLGVQTSRDNAQAGLMVRESLLAESAFFAALKYRGTTNYVMWRDTTGASQGSASATFSLPYYLQIAREGNTFTASRSADGVNWSAYGSPRTMSLPDSVYVGIATSGRDYDSTITLGPATYDNFELCGVIDPADIPAPPTPITPPGLLECRELLEVRGFEGNPTTVFNVWHAGGMGAFSRTSEQYFQGTFSMRLHASLGVYPCAQSDLQPYLYQDVQLPTAVYSITTLSVGGRYRVDASNLECSISGPDEDDVLYLRLLETDGDPITPLTMTHVITNGAAVTGTWHAISRDLSDDVNLEDYQGQPIRIYWNATHDSDYHGTFFYLDELSAQICTQWPVPDLEPGTGSIGGLVRTLNQYYVPVVLPGAEVWAYQQGGQTYETRSIHNGTYHFYNLPPGTYTIHSQTWVGSTLRTATTQVTIGADEVNFNVNLLLQ